MPHLHYHNRPTGPPTASWTCPSLNLPPPCCNDVFLAQWLCLVYCCYLQGLVQSLTPSRQKKGDGGEEKFCLAFLAPLCQTLAPNDDMWYCDSALFNLEDAHLAKQEIGMRYLKNSYYKRKPKIETCSKASVNSHGHHVNSSKFNYWRIFLIIKTQYKFVFFRKLSKNFRKSVYSHFSYNISFLKFMYFQVSGVSLKETVLVLQQCKYT